MGEQKVSLAAGNAQMHVFVRNLLKDVEALEYMLENDWFEKDTLRIGAEQELCMVDKKTLKPATIAMEVLDKMNGHAWAETELAKFNLEVNLTPQVFEGDCLSKMAEETKKCLDKVRSVVNELGAEIILTGILPTLRKFDLELHNLTPKKRYKALIEAINSELIGNAYELRMQGIDELLVKHDSPLLEACNTSFQVHLQIHPDHFVQYYNIAQALAAPTMAIAANSPIVFGKRLWHESRIALFQQALDIRTTHNHMRERSPRVSFGKNWLDKSILEIYKEDIARFRALLSADVQEDSLEMIQNGKAPKLRALQVHNSTVYRWNRPCYGISDNGMPHLRIENRVLPAGPSIEDEMANAALWLGAMEGMAHEVGDVRHKMGWEDVRDNFGKAAQYGIDSKFTWFKDQKISACDLVLEQLIPIARKGLEKRKVKKDDIDKYLGIIEERAKNHMNGSRWKLRAFSKLQKEVGTDEALSVLTHSIIKNQKNSKPVHTWKMPKAVDLDDYHPSKLKVEEFMDTDLLTVQMDAVIELVAEIMDWRDLKYVPVEDSKGNLCGMISSTLLLRHFAKKDRQLNYTATTVKDIMIKDPLTIAPNANIV
ncbi:MAG: glutamate-cysteine ligase family protein, partial [Bacteroidota bacterium]